MNAPTAFSSRRFAHVLDLRVDGPSEPHQCQFGSEFIGGCGGAAWYEYFRDRSTGETYRVRCFDGVNNTKGSFSEVDEARLNRCYFSIIARCHAQADGGAQEVRISLNELIIMRRFTHQEWLESAPGARDGVDSKEGLDGGQVGHCHGVTVVCDLTLKDDIAVIELK